jgi:predicted alpha/beta-fold hydrolase
MPIIESNNYYPNFILRSGHANTILSNILRKVSRPNYQRIRLLTPDHDFLDLDYSSVGGDILVILTHGLEGNSDREYIRGIVNTVNKKGWNALAINLRGCSGEMNKLYSSYHSGMSEDLDLVVNYSIEKLNPKKIILIGYSLGGNITLKYVGEKGKELDSLIKSAAAISVPIMLEDSASQLALKSNWVYMNRFVRKLKPKLIAKLKLHSSIKIDKKAIKTIRNFYDFDALYTAPAHGFSSAEDYWDKSSSRPFLMGIKIPTLLINAKDDPFLSKNCYPYKEAEENPYFYFEGPQYGGHVGFASSLFESETYWHENRMLDFFNDHI